MENNPHFFLLKQPPQINFNRYNRLLIMPLSSQSNFKKLDVLSLDYSMLFGCCLAAVEWKVSGVLDSPLILNDWKGS